MILTDIKLNNFRNYKNVKIKLSDKINIIYVRGGKNMAIKSVSIRIEEEMLEEWVEALWGRFDTIVLEDESDWPIFIM